MVTPEVTSSVELNRTCSIGRPNAHANALRMAAATERVTAVEEFTEAMVNDTAISRGAGGT